ncbi:MAG: cupin domain-containing protein [Defluviicoccus sp.]|nr:cupin domain-containing protein [Defluviicoccus sp.]MDE0278915.1 cupin domain-containing protein [Defluviicoccus sp.]
MEWTNENGFDWCEIVDIDTFVGRLLQPDTRPAKWSGDDIRRAMGYFNEENRRHTDQRRGVTLVNNDIAGSAGASPGISLSFQPILPGETLDFHRHNYIAIYYWIEGEGYTVIDDDGIDREEHRQYWKAGDVTTSPAWSNHAHVCTSDTPALQLAIHDFPELCYKRAMLSEDPDGHENLRHMVKGVVPSFNALDTQADLDEREEKIRIVSRR